MTSRHRITALLGMRVELADGTEAGQVTDVRLSRTGLLRGQLGELVVEGLLVGRRRPGTLFGYDRRPQQGPWLLREVVRRLHRHTGYLGWEDVDRVDWDAGVVRTRADRLRPLPATEDV